MLGLCLCPCVNGLHLFVTSYSMWLLLLQIFTTRLFFCVCACVYCIRFNKLCVVLCARCFCLCTWNLFYDWSKFLANSQPILSSSSHHSSVNTHTHTLTRRLSECNFSYSDLSICLSVLITQLIIVIVFACCVCASHCRGQSKLTSEWVRERTRAFSILQHNPLFVSLRICVNWFVFYSSSEKKRSPARLRSVHIRQRDVINMGDILRGNHSGQSFDPFFFSFGFTGSFIFYHLFSIILIYWSACVC